MEHPFLKFFYNFMDPLSEIFVKHPITGFQTRVHQRLYVLIEPKTYKRPSLIMIPRTEVWGWRSFLWQMGCVAWSLSFINYLLEVLFCFENDICWMFCFENDIGQRYEWIRVIIFHLKTDEVFCFDLKLESNAEMPFKMVFQNIFEKDFVGCKFESKLLND